MKICDSHQYAMNVQNLFSKLKEQMGFHQALSNAEKDSNGTDTVTSLSQNDDTEDDGYLLIDADKYKLITLGAGQTYANGQVSPELPSTQNAFSGVCTNISEPTVFSRFELHPFTSGDSTSFGNQRSPLSDIPFKLHPVLDTQLQANALFHDVSLEPHSFDWSKYSHDFMNEKLCLRDMNSDEMANIDDFSQPCNSLPTRSSEVNLIML